MSLVASRSRGFVRRTALGSSIALFAATVSAFLAGCGNGAELRIDGLPDSGQDGSRSDRGTGGSTFLGGGEDASADAVTADTSQPAPDCDGGGPGCGVLSQCGNSQLDEGETCDDGNAIPGDGCDGTCHKEGSNWLCTPGALCVHTDIAPNCGDGILEVGEQCDQGKQTDGTTNNDGIHGCTTNCQRMPGWSCPTDGGACFKSCGDKVVQNTLGEQCDDGVNDGTKGCTTACQVMVGWTCPTQGGDCSVDVNCGNGVVQNSEQCDDHNRRSYDGCSATCFVESGWSCPPTGGACSRICGNGTLDPGETCDDGNFYSADGCSSTCSVETNYTCPTPGKPCVYTPPAAPPQCGNGILETGEQCDDGNANSGDGCSSTCVVQSGWTCATPKLPCTATLCGDGIVAGTEACDDGNNTANDGCTGCAIDTNAICTNTTSGPSSCRPMVCSDGFVTGTEQCDDANTTAGDGCNATCQIEPGWTCPIMGLKCVPALCGDGIAVGAEQCDEGPSGADCCTADCKLKTDWVCDPSKSPHSQPASAYCGNNATENTKTTVRGLEQCDDHNTVPFDGCSPTCKNEPSCGFDTTVSPAVYKCYAHCGDGLKMNGEECDDGNISDGDGCDHTCKIELNPNTGQKAWDCNEPAAGNVVSMPVIWRDFTPQSHPQFEIKPSTFRRLPGIAKTSLHAVTVGGRTRYVPEYNTAFQSPDGQANWTMNGPGWGTGGAVADTADGLSASGTPALTTGTAIAGRYDQWYTDVTSINQVFPGTISLKQTSATSGVYQYSCNTAGCDSTFTTDTSGGVTPTPGFFPIDKRGWVVSNPVQEQKRQGNHNYHFTTEARYWFIFGGGEQLSFYGDDDLWVFVNGTLALDIGGIHNTLNGYFTLNSNGSALSCAEDTQWQWGNPTPTVFPTTGSTCQTINLGLTTGYVYEVAVFHAERHVEESNFKLTLKGFNNSPTVCTPKCGDGYVVGTEQCDRGTANVDPKLPDGGTVSTYDQCTTSCKLGPYCGDKALTQPPEVCDNGINNVPYAASEAAAKATCAPQCQAPVYCGDSKVQAAYGEECDDGPNNADNTYGHCQTNCLLGPRCGDKTLQGEEQCDDGPNNGSASSSCATNCKAKCGNLVIDVGEKCDDGVNNGTPTSVCSTTCQFKCGDGQLEAGEQCDDGKNDGSYGTCKSDCTYAPYCGDSIVQTESGEACDKGAANSATAYGPDSCTDRCLPGGYCGDGIVNGSEKCDDGVNSGKPGSCLADCSGYVPSASCGDGTVQDPEKCDDGAANGTASSACDTSCRKKCGNGVVEAGEQCDNGVNDGTYGTCRSDCTLAGYCGDGTKNGPEQCDNGTSNVAPASAYGADVCTTLCTWAPFCGDGRIQTQSGEECEGNTQCLKCHWTNPPVH